MTAKIRVDEFQEGLRTRRLGHSILFSREVRSTNDWAKELAAYGADEGTVVVAETQTAGRGRLGKKWFSPKGGLWFSIVLKPRLRVGEAVKIVFVAGLAVAEVLHELYGLRVETKWSNDVLVNGRKVCGILSEMNTTDERVNFAVVGIGINANFAENAFPEELRVDAASIESELGRKVKLDVLFRALLERLESLYDLFMKEGFAPVLEKWKGYAGFLNCKVEVSSASEKWVGLALDVGDDGSLVMRLEDGTVKRVFAGDVSLRLK